MIDIVEDEIDDIKNYLAKEGSNELDRSFYEGKLEALAWVLKNLPEEGQAMSNTNITNNFLWEYTIDREELENQLERNISAEEWYKLKDNLDDAIAGILTQL